MVPLPTPSQILRAARSYGRDLAAWREDPLRDTRVGPYQDLPRHLQATPDSCQDLGDRMCDANPRRGVSKSQSGDGTVVALFGGRLDVTSWLHRKFVGDPYTSRKLKVLDATRAERVALGAAHRAAQLERSAELMASRLEALWRATSDPALRREALFELWDECDEGEGAQGAAGARARAMVIGWIGAQLPAGGPGAYAADELARLNARRSSTRPFAPY
jgi:hypothetical protein